MMATSARLLSAFSLCLAVYDKPVAAYLPGNCRVSGEVPTSGNSNCRVGTQHQQPFAPRQWRPPLRTRREPRLCLSVAEDDEEEGEELEGVTGKGVYVATETLLDDPSHMERILASMAELAPPVAPLEGVFKTAVSHHCALRTSNIVRAMKFYSLLGMNEAARFRAGNARCAFLEGAGMRLELIEVPAVLEPDDKALDLATDMRTTGLNHMAFDVGPAIEAEGLDGMKGFLSELNRQSEDAFGMSVRLVVSPYEQRIGQEIFDLAFVMDADGVLLELVHKKDTLDIDMPQAW
ncbi:unnamed protein product [Ectocarpus sp. 12 AP-2014]